MFRVADWIIKRVALGCGECIPDTHALRTLSCTFWSLKQRPFHSPQRHGRLRLTTAVVYTVSSVDVAKAPLYLDG
ncbi:unnamed protein product [Periconia digitata]|uniref:Uncharacterized protein n=1 Tax=Periconia digitata TaxID=1303443 RepID=A0A9W4UNL2_9PLEO|nr:unnamed protein product [Periconia digitata]